MTEYCTSDREVLRFLFFHKGWADLYELHDKFRLTPAQVLDIVERLIALDFAERKDARAHLKPAGRRWVLEARKDIFLDVGTPSWRPSGEEFLQAAGDPYSPYLPDLRLIDRKYFLKLALNIQTDNASE